jgi:hypothetical protein
MALVEVTQFHPAGTARPLLMTFIDEAGAIRINHRHGGVP